MSDNLMATVAGDLRTIAALHARLLTEAVHAANDPLMPGGKAMVELAHVGSVETWANKVDGLERRWLDYLELPGEDMPNWAEAEDDTWEPPLQTLLFWSEQWRNERGYPLEGRRPTIATEVNFLRLSLEWAWDNEVHFEEFLRDVRVARRRIEDTLSEGTRSLRGAPCMYETCMGARLVRKLQPKRDKCGDKVWVWSDWHCPRCHREWDENRYAANITGAHERAKYEEIDGETWCTYDYAARSVGRPEATIRMWVDGTRKPRTKGDKKFPIAVLCLIKGRRTKFVCLADVVLRHQNTKRRNCPT